jgi:hypothetical protein
MAGRQMKTFREYKLLIGGIFLGFAIAMTAMFFMNAHELYLFKLRNDLGKTKIDIVKINDKLLVFESWAESWEKYKAEFEEARDIIFNKPQEPTRAIKVEEGK